MKEPPGPGRDDRGLGGCKTIAKTRRTAEAIAARWLTVLAARLPLCACRTRKTARWTSRQFQVKSRGDHDGAATASARQTSVVFAAGR